VRWLLLILALVGSCLLNGCSGPRETLTPMAEAKRDTRVMRLEIIAVYNNDRMDYTTEFHVSHVIDATVLDGPPALIGKPIVLPYDLFNVAKPPPAVGSVVVTAPADWVKRNEAGRVRGFGE
jgi:hypothetical protein